MCGALGLDTNEFKGKSRFAAFPHVVFSRGTDEEPTGDCVKCDSVWSLGGYAAEFGSKEHFRQERDKDVGLQHAWKKSCSVWLEAHNAGRRYRVRSEKTRKRKGMSFIDEVQEIRKARKKVVKTKHRECNVSVPMKLMTPERFRQLHKKSIEQSGLVAKWHGTPGGPVWGVLARALPIGEYDAVDQQRDGVCEEEELDSGGDEVRENQQQMKYDVVANKIFELTKAASQCVISAALSVSGGIAPGGGKDGESGDGDSDDDSSSSSGSAASEALGGEAALGFAFDVAPPGASKEPVRAAEQPRSKAIRRDGAKNQMTQKTVVRSKAAATSNPSGISPATKQGGCRSRWTQTMSWRR